MDDTAHHPRPDISDDVIAQWARDRCDDAGALARRITALTAHETDAAAIRAAAAGILRERHEIYHREYGIYDPATGTTEYPGNGDEWMAEWEEIEEAILRLPLIPQPTPEPQGWRPIAEAPQDGRWIFATWNNGEEILIKVRWVNNEWCDELGYNYLSLTHYLVFLPAAPMTGEGE